MSNGLNPLPFSRYIQVELDEYVKKDKKISEMNVKEFFDILIKKFLKNPIDEWDLNSRNLNYLYEKGEKQIEIGILVDYKNEEAPKKTNGPKSRFMYECDCATIFINSDSLSLIGVTYVKLMESKKLFEKSGLFIPNELVSSPSINIPFQKTFDFIPQEIDLSKIPNKIINKTDIDLYLSTTFSTIDISCFELRGRVIYVCCFEEEFIFACKTDKGNKCIIWVPFIPNEKSEEESKKTFERIKKRIKIQNKYLSRGLMTLILKVKENPLPLPERPKDYSYLNASVGDKSTALLAGK